MGSEAASSARACRFRGGADASFCVLLLAGCGETTDPVHRSGTLVKTCPHLRTFYAWQNKLYLKEGNRYRQVDSNDVDVCEQVVMASG